MSNHEQHQRKKLLENKHNAKLVLQLKEVGMEIKTLLGTIAPSSKIADLIKDIDITAEAIQTNFSAAGSGRKRIDDSNINRLESSKDTFKRELGKDFSNTIELIKIKNNILDELLRSQKNIVISQIIIEKISERYNQWPLGKNNNYFPLDEYKTTLGSTSFKYPIVSILMGILQLHHDEHPLLSLLKERMRKYLTPSIQKIFPPLKRNYTSDEFSSDQKKLQHGIRILDKHYKNIYEEFMTNHELLDIFYDVLDNFDFSWTSLPPKYYDLEDCPRPYFKENHIYLCHIQFKNTLYKFDW